MQLVVENAPDLERLLQFVFKYSVRWLGIENEPNTVIVRIAPRDSDEVGSTAATFGPGGSIYMELSYCCHGHLVHALTHELVHARQMIRGELQCTPDHSEVNFRGRVIPQAVVDLIQGHIGKLLLSREQWEKLYHQLPWEEEAHEVGEKLLKEVTAAYAKEVQSDARVFR